MFNGNQLEHLAEQKVTDTGRSARSLMLAFCRASSIHSEYFLYTIDPSIAEHSKRFVFEDSSPGDREHPTTVLQ